MDGIDPKSLSLVQLKQIKEQMDEEVGQISRSIEQLNEARNRFDMSQDSIGRLAKEEIGTDMMVPLTSSMYVNGTVSNTTDVLVDIGTGYHVEMGTEKAVALMGRKADMIQDTLNRLTTAVRQKKKQIQVITVQFNVKMHEAMKQQQQQQAAQNAM